jgi:AraC family transcriptional regulator, regulatory protein of adaptative response / methylated-DNA-[protein]-cysteine methyltransferase
MKMNISPNPGAPHFFPGFDKNSKLRGKSEPSETSNTAWDAVLKRDRHSDGKFVYAALTTGIYCRPSCPARHPLRRNTLLFATAEEAEREGFIACGRCCPGKDSFTLAEMCVKAVLEYIEAHIGQNITLNALSQMTGLSPNHLQQTFKRMTEISPKAYCDARRLAHFKKRLRLGESIISASYGVGYGSSRALYEKASISLGMTPSTYQRGGEGIRIRYAIADGLPGCALLAATESGLCAVLLGKNGNLLFRELREEFPKAQFAREKVPPEKWNAALCSGHREDPLLTKLPLTLRSRLFQAKVLRNLQ